MGQNGERGQRQRQWYRCTGAPGCLRLFQFFRLHRRGVTAVEFALIAPVFAFLLFGIVETSLYYFTVVVLEGKVRDASRQVLTGVAQLSSNPVGTFQTALTSSLTGVLDTSQLVYNVQPFSSFSSIGTTVSPPTSSSFGVNSSNSCNTPIVVTVSYPYSFIVPFVGQVLSGSSSNTVTYTSVIVFQSESYNC